MAPDVFDDLDVLRATTLNLRQKHFLAALVVGSAPRKVLLGFHTLKGSRCISTTLVVLDGPSCSNLID